MKPSSFPQSSTAAKAPKELTEIHEYVEGETHVSLWRATLWERIRFLFHGKLWLFVVGENHPPLVMTIAKDPFVEADQA